MHRRTFVVEMVVAVVANLPSVRVDAEPAPAPAPDTEREADTTPEADAEPVVPTLFGGQLVRATTLAGEAAIDIGGGGALYFAGTAMYWGGGGGRVFQVGEAAGSAMVELFHGELLLGYDLIQARRWFVSAMALAGLGMTRDPNEIVAIAEARLAVRRPLVRWFMLGAHVAYRRAFGSELATISDASLSGPTLGLELYFTH